MSDKFKNKYRIPSARLQNWDYGANATYFITICTKNREHFFGKIIPSAETQSIASNQTPVETQNFASLQQPPNPIVELTPIGYSAYDCWNEIPEHFPFVTLDEFIVMPNHIHGIIIINKPVETQNIASDEPQYFASDEPNLETQNIASLPSQKNKFGPQSQNLASIIRGLKIGVTKFAKNNDIDFAWQPRFHDHIIRDELSYHHIRNYIINNPENWKDDKFYS